MGWWERSNRWVEAHALAIDAVSTGLLLLVSVPTAGTGIYGSAGAAPMFWAGLVVAPLALRRTRPVASAVAVFAAGLLHVLAGFPLFFPADVAVLIALYSVTVYGPRWSHRTAIASALVGSVVLALALALTFQGSGAEVLATWLLASVTALAVWAFGLVRRARYETLTALRDRAERLEVERDHQAQIATAAERTRIAREMHDIIAHSLSVIIAQADGGRYVAQTDPAAAARSLGTIAETGRAALADVRRLLGVLRVGDDGVTASGLAPQPADTDLDQLVAQVRASGLPVSMVRMGAARALPLGAGMVVYRICQESLTNVLKHAGPDPAVTVLVQWTTASLTLEVSDDGRGAGRAWSGCTSARPCSAGRSAPVPARAAARTSPVAALGVD